MHGKGFLVMKDVPKHFSEERHSAINGHRSRTTLGKEVD
jgi:hypothetical protein